MVLSGLLVLLMCIVLLSLISPILLSPFTNPHVTADACYYAKYKKRSTSTHDCQQDGEVSLGHSEITISWVLDAYQCRLDKYYRVIDRVLIIDDELRWCEPNLLVLHIINLVVATEEIISDKPIFRVTRVLNYWNVTQVRLTWDAEIILWRHIKLNLSQWSGKVQWDGRETWVTDSIALAP